MIRSCFWVSILGYNMLSLLAQQITHFFERFFFLLQTSYWVMDEVLNEETQNPKVRAEIISQFIRITKVSNKHQHIQQHSCTGLYNNIRNTYNFLLRFP